MSSCTNLDHIYPNGENGRKPADGTPCLCGARRWNQDSASYTGPTEPAKPIAERQRLPRARSRVDVRTPIGPLHRQRVVEVDREAGMFRVESIKGWLEVGDLL